MEPVDHNLCAVAGKLFGRPANSADATRIPGAGFTFAGLRQSDDTLSGYLIPAIVWNFGGSVVDAKPV